MKLTLSWVKNHLEISIPRDDFGTGTSLISNSSR
jgi:hypothetical protein